MSTREDILSLAEDLEDGVQRNGSMDGEDGAVDLYDIDAANEVMGEAAKMLRTLASPTPPAAEAAQADMAAFGASDVACYLYPDSGKERAAFIAGAAHAAEALGQEPVAFRYKMDAGDGHFVWNYASEIDDPNDPRCEPLYLASPAPKGET